MSRDRVKVRRAEAFDVARIGRLLEDAYKTAGTPYPPPQPIRLVTWVLNTIIQSHQQGGFCSVATVDGDNRIVGSLGMSVVQVPWADQMVLNNEWFYVYEKYRKKGVADALLTHMERWVDKHKAPIMMGIMDMKDRELKERFLKRRKGYQVLGANLMRWPQDGDTVRVQE